LAFSAREFLFAFYLEISNLQTMPFKQACFWRKNRAILQKNGGLTEIILHFFLRFFCFLGLFPLQLVVSEQQAPVSPLQKKSCLKSYRRFFERSGICHNRRMNDEKFNGTWAATTPRGGDRPGYAGSKDRQLTRPPAAIQPSPIAASTSQYK
jgi:hypothetical protein